ncbi:MAG TPA: CRTAC1 family protein [Vicinamibacteria bacterium]|nr:CRTAC1 family protein [Vicinamibacteria bacterium]
MLRAPTKHMRAQGLFWLILAAAPSLPRFSMAQTNGDPCSGPCFTNVSSSAGFLSPQNFGGHGIQVVDVNGDGWLDVYVTHIANPAENRPDLLFMNEGRNPLTLAEAGVANGVSDDGFLEGVSAESHAAVFADLDNDGDYDLFNVHTWNGNNRLYRNEGTGHFVDLTESAGIEITDLGSRGVSAADLNADGLLDLVVSAWQGAQPIVYWNLGGLRFERVRVKGVDNRPFANQGISTSDYDGDGRPDLALTAFEYLENEGRGPIALLRNEGDRFSDATDFASLVYERRSRETVGTNGVSFADFDNDGTIDILITGGHGSKLYRNNGEGRFHLMQIFDGIHYTGAFGDLDNDGDLDLYFAGETGVYLNNGSGGFGRIDEVGLEGIGNDARAAVLADLDNDGALDVLIASKQGSNSLFLNRSQVGSWIKVSLIGPQGNAGAFGARVKLHAAGGAERLLGMREARSGTGYCAQDAPVLHFGTGTEALVDLVVTFPDGSSVTRSGVPTGQTLVVDGRTP